MNTPSRSPLGAFYRSTLGVRDTNGFPMTVASMATDGSVLVAFGSFFDTIYPYKNNKILYSWSTDGNKWKTGTMDVDFEIKYIWPDVKYVFGKFWARFSDASIGNTSNLYTSNDGKTWVKETSISDHWTGELASSFNWDTGGLIVGNGMMLVPFCTKAVTSQLGEIRALRTSDGITWDVTGKATNYIGGLDYTSWCFWGSLGLFGVSLHSRYYDDPVKTSSNGDAPWTYQYSAPRGLHQRSVYNSDTGSTFIYRSLGSVSTGIYKISSTGVWSFVFSSFGYHVNLSYNDGIVMIINRDSATAHWTNDDGTTWISHPQNKESNFSPSDACYFNGAWHIFVDTSSASPTLATGKCAFSKSTDLINWTTIKL